MAFIAIDAIIDAIMVAKTVG